jgi:hypothetical protein
MKMGKVQGDRALAKRQENVEIFLELTHEDRRRTLPEPADSAGIRYTVCQEIVTDNDMRRIADKFLDS